MTSGDQLTEGPVDPHDVLAVKGETELQRYLVDKIQEVYRTQGVTINDKHIETIVRQMCRFVKITDPGDTEFLLDEQVPRYRVQDENERDREARRSACAIRAACSWVSPRRRSRPSRSSRRLPSRRPRGCSPRLRSRAGLTISTVSRRT